MSADDPNRFAPPVADVRDPPPPAPDSFATGRLVGELASVIENAMARFDAVPGATPLNRSLRMTGRWRGDAALLAGNRAWVALGGLGAFLLAALVVHPSFAMTSAGCGVFLVVALAVEWRLRRQGAAASATAVHRMPAQLAAVAGQVATLRAVLPASHARLGEALEAVEARMARTFTASRHDLTAALLKLTGKAFGYAGFAEFALREPQAAIQLELLRTQVAQALAVPAAAV